MADLRVLIAKWLILLLCLFVLSGCYPSMKLKVVDAVTGEPVQKAIVHVIWTQGKGFPGLSSSTVVDVSEQLTDGKGEVIVPGRSWFGVDDPCLTVYKVGYIAWNNIDIFPDYMKRTDFRWSRQNIIKLDKRILDKDDREKHLNFLGHTFRYGITRRHGMIEETYEQQQRIYEEDRKRSQ